MELLRQIVGQFLTGPVMKAPYHQIGQIDSRMWDPKWRARYGKHYTNLRAVIEDVNLKAFDPRFRNQAYTMASNESYLWGRRGNGPALVLVKFEKFSPVDVVRRMRGWVRRVNRGDTLMNQVNAFLAGLGNPVPAVGDARMGPGLGVIAEQGESPME